MDTRFKNSFIPKKPIQIQTSTGIPNVRVKSKRSFFSLFALILFLVAIGASVGVFMWKIALNKTIESQIETLKRDRDSLDPGFLDEATTLNQRIIAANRLLEKHVAPSAIFDLLADSTLKTVQFLRFQFVDGEDGLVKVVAEGLGDEFSSIVLQSDEFGKTGFLRDVIFSDLQSTEKDDVDFRFEATIDPRLILYNRKIVKTSENVQDSNLNDNNDINSFE